MDLIRMHMRISGSPCVGPLGTTKESVNLRGGSELQVEKETQDGWLPPPTETYEQETDMYQSGLARILGCRVEHKNNTV